MGIKRVAAAVTVLVLLVVGGRAGWTWWGERAGDGVVVTTDYECSGTRLSTFRQRPAIDSRPGWECTAHVQVLNRAGREIRVDRIVGPMMGSRMGSEAVALPGGVGDPTGEVDATWTVDETVPRGGSRTFDLRLGWREDGCSSGGHFYVDGWPTVVVRSLARTVHVPSLDPLQLKTFSEPEGDGTTC